MPFLIQLHTKLISRLCEVYNCSKMQTYSKVYRIIQKIKALTTDFNAFKETIGLDPDDPYRLHSFPFSVSGLNKDNCSYLRNNGVCGGGCYEQYFNKQKDFNGMKVLTKMTENMNAFQDNDLMENNDLNNLSLIVSPNDILSYRKDGHGITSSISRKKIREDWVNVVERHSGDEEKAIIYFIQEAIRRAKRKEAEGIIAMLRSINKDIQFYEDLLPVAYSSDDDSDNKRFRKLIKDTHAKLNKMKQMYTFNID